MLQSLHIKNYALIEALKIEFDKGFIVLTGETGAGKSIILGALGLLLGERANLSSIGDNEKKCIVEGEFLISDYNLQSFFNEADIDYEDTAIIRRELSPSRKSRAFINDTPVTLAVLKKLTSKLIDIHSQHQNLQIENESFQFSLVDNYSNNHKILSDYQTAYKSLQKLQSKRDELMNSQNQQSVDIDYWNFQLEELKSADLKINEQEELEKENNMLSQMEHIMTIYSQADTYFNSELSPVDKIRNFAKDFQALEDVHESSTALGNRLESLYLELKDILSEISAISEQLQIDPERAVFVSERLDNIYRLQQKHSKQTISELLELQDELENKVNAVQFFDQNIAELNSAIERQINITNRYSENLSKERLNAIPKIEKDLTDQLKNLGMPHANITINLKSTKDFRMQGKEHINILFTANKNGTPASINDVASGGELSRLMLSIKQLMAKSMTLPTLIFDEIDTGVSGEIADKMGDSMLSMSNNIQIIAITHLPQIAAKAKQHWNVYKIDTDVKTATSIKLLNEEERIQSIAKMLSGSAVTKEAMQNAKSLLLKY